MADRSDDEIRRLAEVLATVVRVAGRTRQSLEEQIGLSSGYLSKILGGTVDLRARHILVILDAVGMEPAEFFRLAYPRPQTQGSGSSARRLIESVQEALGQGAVSEPASSPDFDQQVKRSLVRLLGLGPDAPETE